jgi:isoquinoline 1-oxidoreductase beta subunit
MNAIADELRASNLGASQGLSRREFLLRLQAMGGLLLVADGLRIAKAAPTDPPKYGAEGMPHGTVDNPLVFLTVG